MFVASQNTKHWSPVSSPPHEGRESSFGRRCLRQGSSISCLHPGKIKDALVCHCCPKGDSGQWSGTLCWAQMGCKPSQSLLLCRSLRKSQLTCGEEVWDSYAPLPDHHCLLKLGKQKSPAELCLSSPGGSVSALTISQISFSRFTCVFYWN